MTVANWGPDLGSPVRVGKFHSVTAAPWLSNAIDKWGHVALLGLERIWGQAGMGAQPGVGVTPDPSHSHSCGKTKGIGWDPTGGGAVTSPTRRRVKNGASHAALLGGGCGEGASGLFGARAAGESQVLPPRVGGRSSRGSQLCSCLVQSGKG